MSRERGFVKHWFPDKGFGFISNGVNRRDYFVHRTQIGGLKDLQPDDAVEFLPSTGPKGPCAKEVQVLK